jgi:hypothetical protein
MGEQQKRSIQQQNDKINGLSKASVLEIHDHDHLHIKIAS